MKEISKLTKSYNNQDNTGIQTDIQTNGIEYRGPEINPCLYGQMIVYKGAKRIQ